MSDDTVQEKNKNERFELIKFIVVALLLALIFRFFIAQPFIVRGSSMSPTFESGNYLIVDQVTYRLDDPKRGDVIVFRNPQNTSEFFIKRIIGLPSEKVILRENKVIIEKEGFQTTLDETYIEFNRDTFLEKELDNDEYFVMGDNRVASSDSRSWGALEEDLIIGKVFIRLLPVNNIDFLPGNV